MTQLRHQTIKICGSTAWLGEVFRGTRPEWLRDKKVLIWAEIGLEKYFAQHRIADLMNRGALYASSVTKALGEPAGSAASQGTARLANSSMAKLLMKWRARMLASFSPKDTASEC